MPVSRPSRAGEPTPRVRPAPDYYEEENAEVDKRLAQLDKAREKAKEARLRKQEEAERRGWDELKRDLRLSRLEESLLRAVDGKAPSARAAIKGVYGASWERLSKRRRGRFLGKLRVLQNALNRKLAAAGSTVRATMRDGKIRLVKQMDWKKPRARRGAQRSASMASKRKAYLQAAADCAEFIRSLFANHRSIKDGCLPVRVLNEAACQEGFRPGTIRSARKRLKLISTRAGYGGRGGWSVSLPGPKPART